MQFNINTFTVISNAMLPLIFRRTVGKNHPEQISPQYHTCQEDPLENFFRCIANTMRTFPQTDIAELKLTISNAVCEREIAIAMRQNSKNDVRYVLAVNSQHEEKLIPVEIQNVDYANTDDDDGCGYTGHQFLQLQSGM